MGYGNYLEIILFPWQIKISGDMNKQKIKDLKHAKLFAYFATVYQNKYLFYWSKNCTVRKSEKSYMGNNINYLYYYFASNF